MTSVRIFTILVSYTLHISRSLLFKNQPKQNHQGESAFVLKYQRIQTIGINACMVI